MVLEIIVLGTACMVPTKERNHPGFLLVNGKEVILFDCGEGIQRQLKIAGFRPTRIKKILLTHWHGDHSLGLPGLIQTMASMGHSETLEIYGPPGTKKKITALKQVFKMEDAPELKIKEIKKPGVFFENDDYSLWAEKMKHRLPTLGFSYQQKDKVKIYQSKLKEKGLKSGPLVGQLLAQKKVSFKGKTIHLKDVSWVKKGKKVVYITDTAINKNCLKLAHQADLLICEATFAPELQEKAEKSFHLDVSQAAGLAGQAEVKHLLLTHFSARYKTVSELVEAARTIFKNTRAAYDFMKIKV